MDLAGIRLRTDQLAAVTLLGLVFLFTSSVPLWHTDVWGHLAFGRTIAETGRLPEGNPFSPWLADAAPSNHYAWLSQLALYRIHALGEWLAGGSSVQRMAGGVDALRFTHALLVLLCLAVLLRAYRRVSGSLPLALTGVVLVTLLSRNLAIFRPQVLGELCFALLLLGLSREAGPSRAGRLWIPALMVLWANLHGSYVFGLALLSLALAGGLLSREPVRSLLVVWAASVLGVGLLNPAGPAIYLRTLAMAGHPVLAQMREWQPLSLASGGLWIHLLVLALVLGSLLRARRWPSPTRLLVLVFFAGLPLLHQRALVWWLLVAPWIALPAWAQRRSGDAGERSAGPLRALAAALLLMAFALGSIPGRWVAAGQPTPLERSVSEGTPWRLALALRRDPERSEGWSPGLESWLRRNHPEGGFRGPIFSSEMLGDYLVWALPPEMPPFVYGHVHLFTQEHWRLYSAVRSGGESWSQVLDRFGIDLVVVEAELDPRLRDRLWQSPDWEVVLDESGDPDALDRYGRLLVAVRSGPLDRLSRRDSR